MTASLPVPPKPQPGAAPSGLTWRSGPIDLVRRGIYILEEDVDLARLVPRLQEMDVVVAVNDRGKIFAMHLTFDGQLLPLKDGLDSRLLAALELADFLAASCQTNEGDETPEMSRSEEICLLWDQTIQEAREILADTRDREQRDAALMRHADVMVDKIVARDERDLAATAPFP